MRSSALARTATVLAPAGRSGVAEATRMFRKSGSAVFGLGLVVALGAAAVLAPLLAPHDPTRSTPRAGSRVPSPSGHPLGTDEFGRDLLSRLLYGARTSLVVGLAATVLAALAGSICGLLAGFVGRWVDQVGDALDRHPDGLPLLPARDRDHRHARSGPRQRHGRGRRS